MSQQYKTRAFVPSLSLGTENQLLGGFRFVGLHENATPEDAVIDTYHKLGSISRQLDLIMSDLERFVPQVAFAPQEAFAGQRGLPFTYSY